MRYVYGTIIAVTLIRTVGVSLFTVNVRLKLRQSLRS